MDLLIQRTLHSVSGETLSPARELAFRYSIDLAIELMRRLDARFPLPGGWPSLRLLRELAPSISGCALSTQASLRA
jgi:hypothetical protein